jgi:polysaccharide pyruvyl transferase WcaK-like protein
VVLDYGIESHTYEVDVDTSRVNVPLINLRFSKKLYLSNHVLVVLALALLLRLSPTRRLRVWLCQHNSRLAALDSIDIAASVAAGDSFSDIYGLTHFFYVVLPQLICIALGKPLVLFPQTHGPFRSAIAKATARFILRRAKYVYSRDHAGLDTVHQLVGRRPTVVSARFCRDLGILLSAHPVHDAEFEALSSQSTLRDLVGLNVSGLLSSVGAQFAARSGFPSDYDSLVRSLIWFLVKKRRASVMLIPHVFGRGRQSDLVACENLVSRLPSEFKEFVGIVTGPYDQHAIKHIIGSCDFFIGSRMHACIAAVSQGVPAVSLAYSDKFLGVMETMGVSKLVADLRLMKTPDVLELVDVALDKRAVYREQLQRQMPVWRNTVLNVLADCDL